VSERVCKGCGEPLAPKTWQGRDRVWCSERCRKQQYGGTCIDCGAPTDGSNGRPGAPDRCFDCIKWTREAALLAVQEYFDEHGEPPRIPRRPNGLPHNNTVKRLFGGWNNLLLVAGLPLVCDRRPEVWDDVVRRVLAGETVKAIAEERGCTESSIYKSLQHRGIRLSGRRAAA
jgi:hypothetical protein